MAVESKSNLPYSRCLWRADTTITGRHGRARIAWLKSAMKQQNPRRAGRDSQEEPIWTARVYDAPLRGWGTQVMADAESAMMVVTRRTGRDHQIRDAVLPEDSVRVICRCRASEQQEGSIIERSEVTRMRRCVGTSLLLLWSRGCLTPDVLSIECRHQNY